MCLGVKRHLASAREISRLQHGLQLIMARNYTRIINCRPCCNLYLLHDTVCMFCYHVRPTWLHVNLLLQHSDRRLAAVRVSCCSRSLLKHLSFRHPTPPLHRLSRYFGGGCKPNRFIDPTVYTDPTIRAAT